MKEYNKNKFTEYTFTRKYGIDDLKSEYAFHGNSQGDESVSNDVRLYKASGGWMSYIFKDVPLNQRSINAEVLKRKKYNIDYIKKLKKEGNFGKKYNQIISVASDPTYDKNKITLITEKSTESYRFDIININKK